MNPRTKKIRERGGLKMTTIAAGGVEVLGKGVKGVLGGAAAGVFEINIASGGRVGFSFNFLIVFGGNETGKKCFLSGNACLKAGVGTFVKGDSFGDAFGAVN